MARLYRIAAIGECMIELRDDGRGGLSLGYGGDSLNTSVYLARVGKAMGLSVDYVTALGDDPYSDAMLAGWMREGVGTGLVARLPGRLPGLYAIRTDEAGERSFFYWRSAAAARDLFRASDAEQLARALSGYDLLYMTGITLSIFDDDGRRRLIALADRARERGARIAFDSNYRPRGWPDVAAARHVMTELLRRTDVALLSLDDERALFGDPDAAACARRIADLGVGEVVVKDAARSCHIRLQDKTWDVPGEPVARPVDTTAAGDAFNAAYLARRLAEASPDAAARAAHRLAAAVIQHRGAIIPSEAMPGID